MNSPNEVGEKPTSFFSLPGIAQFRPTPTSTSNGTFNSTPPFHFPLYEFLDALDFPARRFQNPSRTAMAALLRCARTAPICFGRGGRIAATTGAARSTGAGSAILRVPKYPLVEFPKR